MNTDNHVRTVHTYVCTAVDQDFIWCVAIRDTYVIYKILYRKVVPICVTIQIRDNHVVINLNPSKPIEFQVISLRSESIFNNYGKRKLSVIAGRL